MPREPQIFGSAVAANDFFSGDYCGTSYAAKLLGLSVTTVQSLVEKGEIEAWKTLGGHRRLSLRAINNYLQKNSPQMAQVDLDPRNRLSVLVVEDESAETLTYRIVGPDETDASTGAISFDSPLARALLKKRSDDEVTVETPGGRRVLFILSVCYE